MVLINGGPALDRFGPTNLVGRLVSPRSGNRILSGQVWAADNDAFGVWDESRFLRMLNRLDAQESIRSRCLFVVAPDVVCDARATLERFWEWRYEIVGRGFPVALALQNGAEDCELPWNAFDTVFIGGDTAYKLSATVAELAQEARRRGKWVHMGRVNTRRRLKVARDFEVDSVDGTGWSRWPDIYLRKELPFIKEISEQRLIWDSSTP